jgi:hypothetical protein
MAGAIKNHKIIMAEKIILIKRLYGYTGGKVILIKRLYGYTGYMIILAEKL